MTPIYAALILLLVYQLLGIWWGGEQRLLLALCALPAFLLILYTANQSLSWPKPLWLEFDQPTEPRVLAYVLADPQIYVWLDTGEGAPRSYAIDFDLELAKQLHAGQREVREGRKGEMRLRTGIVEGERVFHPDPVEGLPSKQ